MKKNSLSKTGLSMSQASSISNLIFQRTREIDRTLSGVNNASKSLKIAGETYVETQGKPLPSNVVDLILEKGKLHATQAFLMENIKAKEALIKSLQIKSFVSKLIYPNQPEYRSTPVEPMVNEAWGWEQLTVAENSDYLENEALAAHIGQFIHKGSILDNLRNELPHIKTLEWMTIEDGKKTPMKVEIHHTSHYLLAIHNKLAEKHREYEQRVNYFKAKVKNAVTTENARIARLNADMQSSDTEFNNKLRLEYQSAFAKHSEAMNKERQDFEEKRQNEIREAAALRIQVDPRFQEVVNNFLTKE